MGFKGEFSFPIIADLKRELSTKLGMLDPDEKDKAGMPLNCRAVSPWLDRYCLATFSQHE